jgi:hypothetical protein
LREELAELRNQNSQLETKIAEMQSSGDVKTLQAEVELLGNVNQLLGRENDDIRNKLNRFEKYRFPGLSQETTTNFGSSTEEDVDLPKRKKRRKSNKPKLSKKAKGKRKMRYSNDESSSKSSEDSDESSEENEKNESGARVCNFFLLSALAFI